MPCSGSRSWGCYTKHCEAKCNFEWFQSTNKPPLWTMMHHARVLLGTSGQTYDTDAPTDMRTDTKQMCCKCSLEAEVVPCQRSHKLRGQMLSVLHIPFVNSSPHSSTAWPNFLLVSEYAQAFAHELRNLFTERQRNVRHFSNTPGNSHHNSNIREKLQHTWNSQLQRFTHSFNAQCWTDDKEERVHRNQLFADVSMD